MYCTHEIGHDDVHYCCECSDAEIESLRAERDESNLEVDGMLSSLNTSLASTRKLRARAEAAERALGKAAKDTERLDWLESNMYVGPELSGENGPDDLWDWRDCIDEARGAMKGGDG